ncbi:DUF58 domain-containing protein [Phytopseudomonas punonensis]|uniref:Uncharacterized conserved protein, DUF58 family, contains vWF domain n=1 Tax=Phytopseudomonas punonensis TaxID=1220495 RepID=A0A1M7LUV0_9GAMM|nr:DUF58 domain-containing protein [Pseudomonas punonensis]SHM81995.1 Uncharacterized conserved protein, DUF58 family, contains vWF domain [Pseudomonas punonensis]
MTTAFNKRWNRWLAKRIPAAASVQLNQRRIFILPSRVGVAFLFALLVMLLAAINYQSSLAYGLTFLLGSVFIVTILHTYRNLAGLVLHAGGAGPVFAGESARLRVRLESRGRAHEAIALGWPPAELQQLDVAAQGSAECELGQQTQRRGWLRPGRLRVESRFPLGLLVAWSHVDLDQAVLVYPRPLEGELPLAAGGREDDEQAGQLSQGQGSDDFQGLRTYQPGDSRKRLHWKAYSRGHGLLVKDFAAQSGRDLLLDFDVLSGDLESRLSLLCHWVLVLCERQQPFGLQLPNEVLPVAIGERHREECLRALALCGAQV